VCEAHWRERERILERESTRARESTWKTRASSEYELQHAYTATNCNTLRHIATCCNRLQYAEEEMAHLAIRYTLQHALTVTHCNLLQHCNTLQHIITHHNIFNWISRDTMHIPTRHTATRCNTLQHITTHYNILRGISRNTMHTTTRTHCNTLQRTTLHYRTLQHTEVAISQYETTCCTAVVGVVNDIHSGLVPAIVGVVTDKHSHTHARTHARTGTHMHRPHTCGCGRCH